MARARASCGVAHDEPALGHRARRAPERRLVRRRVRVDVDVVVLDARDDGDVVRADADVVEELRLLVPVDGVVLVALDDEGRAPERSAIEAASSSSPMAAPARQALRDAADEPARLADPRSTGATRTSRSSSSCRACPRRPAGGGRRGNARAARADMLVRGRPMRLGRDRLGVVAAGSRCPRRPGPGAATRCAASKPLQARHARGCERRARWADRTRTSEPLTSCPASRRAPPARPCPCPRRRRDERACGSPQRLHEVNSRPSRRP